MTCAMPIASLSDFAEPGDWGQDLSRGIHPKLEVGDVEDPLEREADAVADQVMGMPALNRDVTKLRKVKSGKGPANAHDGLLARKCEACEDEEELRRVHAGPSGRGDGKNAGREPGGGWRGGSTTNGFADRLRARARSGGRPLPDSASNFLEPRR